MREVGGFNYFKEKMGPRSVVKLSSLLLVLNARDFCCLSLMVKEAHTSAIITRQPPDLCGGNLLQDRQEDLGRTTYPITRLETEPSQTRDPIRKYLPSSEGPLGTGTPPLSW